LTIWTWTGEKNSLEMPLIPSAPQPATRLTRNFRHKMHT
jgi:hypothetical protein